VIGPGFQALLIEAAGPAQRGMRILAGQLTELGARVALLTDRGTGGRSAEAVIRVRTGLPEELTPLPFAVAGRLLALGMAGDLGVDPARPRGLRKVTVTRCGLVVYIFRQLLDILISIDIYFGHVE
jgi:glucosamine 6-phosphate synthetase-like amidotransferase/phosphosugar isomerase protein